VSRSAVFRPLLLAVVGAMIACNDVTLPSQTLPTFIRIISGDQQTGEVGSPLPDSLVVRVTDVTGRPVKDAVVHFVPMGVAADGQLIPDTASTNADGQAWTRWVLGAHAGSATLEAQVPQGGRDEIRTIFSATAVPGPPAIVRGVQGDGQSETAGMLLPDSLAVVVTDQYGNGLPGQSVAWQASDGSVSASRTTTGADGRTSVAWRLGSRAGSQSAQAAITGLTGSPVTFSATALPGPPVALIKIFGDGQTAPVGTRLTDSLVAQLVDALGNGVPGRSINWVVSPGAGSAAPTTGTTDPGGRAFTRWTLGPGSGSQVLNAVVSGFDPAAFTATAISQAAASLRAASPTTLVGQAGQPVSPPPSVRVTDVSGNPVQGVSVTFAVLHADGQVSSRTGQGSVVTVASDDAGIAAVTSWTLGSVAGTDTLEASAVGASGPLSGSPVRFIAVGLPGVASRLAFLQQPTMTVAGMPISPPVTVAVQDLSGNLIASYAGTVTLTLGSSPPGGTLGGTTTAGVIGGVATFSGLTVQLVGSGYTLVASSQPALTPATSDSFAVLPGSAGRLAMVTQPSDTAVNGVRLPRQPVVRLEDNFGNPVSQPAVGVTVSIASGGGGISGAVTAVTAATGVASFADLSLAGLVGPRTLLFSAPGFQPVSSTPVALVTGPAAVLALQAGGDQSANVGTSVAVPPGVKVTDLGGNPVGGVAVAFAVTGGGGTITGPNAVTDALGVAAVGSWQLGPTKGTNTLAATSVGLAGSPLSISAVGRFAYLTVRAGAEFSCGSTTAGTSYCWGRNNRGQIGNGGTTDQLSPVPVAGGLQLQTIGLGYEHACGLTAAGAAYCWGLNGNGQLGDGTSTNRLAPVAVAGGLAFVAIEGGDAHTCALTAAGAAYCWGQNNNGQLGDGTTTVRSAPVAVAGGISFRALALGTEFSCGVATNGTAYCWGVDVDGKPGNGKKSSHPTPTTIAGTGWSAIAVGEEFACVLSAGGAASCWGLNDKGQLGDGTKTNRAALAPVAGGLAFSRLDAGGAHACGLTVGGAAYCWGLNADGEVGDGSLTDRMVPTSVQGGNLFGAVSAGGMHTVALSPTGVAYGWGRDANGQLGTGTTTDKPTPVLVREP